jgi:hypothetical protein
MTLRHWNLKHDGLDRGITPFGTRYGPVAKQATERMNLCPSCKQEISNGTNTVHFYFYSSMKKSWKFILLFIQNVTKGD